jgi:glycosyltransferase involved in cell wall biosynthesis
MSRILLSAYACEPGKGSEPEVGWMWATELAALSHEVWVITREANREAIEREKTKTPNPKLHFVYFDLPAWVLRWKRGGRGVHWYYALWQLGAFLAARRLKTHRFDFVQHVTFVGLRAPSLMGYLGVPFVLGPVSGGECVPPQLRKGMTLTAQVRELVRDLGNLLVKVDPVMQSCFRCADRILVATEDSRYLVPAKFHNKCELQLGIGLSRDYLGWTGPGRRLRAKELRLLYAGRLLEWKGVDLALRAIKRLAERGVDARFTIVGDGPAAVRLKQLAVELEVNHLVRWNPWVQHEQLTEAYATHDLLVFPACVTRVGW